MKPLRFLLLTVCILSLFACSETKKEEKEYPMFWTWLDYRPGTNFDSICSVMKETGLDGVILNAATPDHYREAIPVAHKYGLEVYAWVWTINDGSMVKEHPEWYSVNRKGESLADSKAYVDYYKFMCPALPEVREHIKNRIREFCKVDGLNGIAIDYHRFVDVILPTTLWPTYGIVQDREYPEWDFGYHPEMIRLFKEKYGYDPREQEDPSTDEKWLQFRCDQITEVANEIAEVVHSYGKKMGASPFPTPAMSRAMVRQDWGKWNLDIVFPMVYHNFYTGDVSFIEDCTIDNVKQKNPKTTLFCGMMPSEESEIFECMDAALNNGAEGISIFTINSLRSPEVRAQFKAYADSARTARATSKESKATMEEKMVNTNPFEKKRIMDGVHMRMKAYLSLDKVAGQLGNMKHWLESQNAAIRAMQVNTADDYIKHLKATRNVENPSTMLAIAEQFEKDNSELVLNLGEYKLTDEYGATKHYQVTDENSKVTFDVTFYFYGGVISGWNVEPAKKA